jgi:hypothetical protein
MQATDEALEVAKLVNEPNLFVRGPAAKALGAMEANERAPRHWFKLLQDPARNVSELVSGTCPLWAASDKRRCHPFLDSLLKEVMLRDIELPAEYAEGLEGVLLKHRRTSASR